MVELKKTELGLIPKEWDVKKLVETAYINPENLPKETNNETIINYIDIESVITGKILNIKKMLFKFAPSRARRVIIKDDIIISTVRPYLKAIAMINSASENLVCSTGFAVVRAKNNVLPKYIYQCILNDNFNNQLISKMVGSNYPAVTGKDIEQALILIPPINEQNKIASILSTVDELIENTDHLINSYTLLKKGLMQALLTKGIGHTKFKKTDLGEIPNEWESQRLSEFCYFRQGFQIPMKEQIKEPEEGYLRFLYITDFISDKKTWFVKDNESYYKVSNEDIVVANTGSAGKVFRGKSGILSNNMFKIFFNDKVICNEFFYQFLNSQYYENQMEANFNYTGRAHVGHDNMGNIKIALPKINEQIKIASILSNVDKIIESCVFKNEKLKLLKKGLMQQLLTGKIRVKV